MLFGYNIFILGSWRSVCNFWIHLKLCQPNFYLIAHFKQVRLFIRQNPPYLSSLLRTHCLTHGYLTSWIAQVKRKFGLWIVLTCFELTASLLIDFKMTIFGKYIALTLFFYKVCNAIRVKLLILIIRFEFGDWEKERPRAAAKHCVNYIYSMIININKYTLPHSFIKSIQTSMSTASRQSSPIKWIVFEDVSHQHDVLFKS
jgi:hypothetical protein